MALTLYMTRLFFLWMLSLVYSIPGPAASDRERSNRNQGAHPMLLALHDKLLEDPQHEETLSRLVEYYGMPDSPGKDSKRSVDFARQLLAVNPRKWQSHYVLGAAANESGDPNQALVHFAQVLDLHSNNPRILHDVAITYMDVGQPDKALPLLEAANKLQADVLDLLELLGALNLH